MPKSIKLTMKKIHITVIFILSAFIVFSQNTRFNIFYLTPLDQATQIGNYTARNVVQTDSGFAT